MINIKNIKLMKFISLLRAKTQPANNLQPKRLEAILGKFFNDRLINRKWILMFKKYFKINGAFI
jgi:hypothetical protein